MKVNLLYKGSFIALSLSLLGCNEASQPGESDFVSSIEVTNPLNKARKDSRFIIDAGQLKAFNKPLANLLVMDKQNTLSTQPIDTDNNGVDDSLLVIADFAANETKTLTLSVTESKPLVSPRVQVDFSRRQGGRLVNGQYQGGEYVNIQQAVLEQEHVPGDRLYRYEGPGWESELVAYRLYFDQRNIIDIFGKKRNQLELQHVGQQDANYHAPSEWGMDVLKVGKSLGMGAPALWVNNQVHTVNTAEKMQVTLEALGPLQASLEVAHTNWHVNAQILDISNQLSIVAGSRLTHSEITLSQDAIVATGIVKHPNTELLSSDIPSAQWQYIASWGAQSEAGDHLGMAVFYPTDQLNALTSDENNYLVLLNTQDNAVHYYFAATWEQDSSAIATKSAFIDYLNAEVARLNHPISTSSSD